LEALSQTRLGLSVEDPFHRSFEKPGNLEPNQRGTEHISGVLKSISGVREMILGMLKFISGMRESITGTRYSI
jgi:hypothetical protein